MINLSGVVIADVNEGRRDAVVSRLPDAVTKRECNDLSVMVRLLTDSAPAVVIIGSLPGGASEAIQAAHHARAVCADTKVILVADFSSEALAIAALRAGVSEYLKSPLTSLEIAEAAAKFLPPAQPQDDDFPELVGASPKMRGVKDLIYRVAPMPSTVLISGETGTGKEVVARLIHRLSPRSTEDLICVNCAAIPDALLESELFGCENGAFTGAARSRPGQLRLADRGTVFLDEIGDMSELAQSKLLRAIEQREVRPLGGSKLVPLDVRFVAATHRKLESLVEEGRFRSDLFYRLNVARIHLPSLRERIEDIPELAMYFLRQLSATTDRRVDGFRLSAMRRLMRHDWPGNVRELRNVIEAALVVCDSRRISGSDLRVLRLCFAKSPVPMRTAVGRVLATSRLQPEPERLLHALKATNWNMTKAAEILQWSRMTVYRKVARYGMERPAESARPIETKVGDDEVVDCKELWSTA